jgi:hypothetical protein
MDIALELANYLENANYGTVGTNIFAGQIPDETNGIYIVRTGGLPNNYVPIEETVLDIYVKSSSANDCITTLESIKRFIHRMHTTEINDAYIYTFLVLSDVEDVQRDLEYVKIFKITLQVVYRDTGLIS